MGVGRFTLLKGVRFALVGDCIRALGCCLLLAIAGSAAAEDLRSWQIVTVAPADGDAVKAEAVCVNTVGIPVGPCTPPPAAWALERCVPGDFGLTCTAVHFHGGRDGSENRIRFLATKRGTYRLTFSWLGGQAVAFYRAAID